MSRIIVETPEPLPPVEWAELRRLIADARRYAREQALADPVIGPEFAPVVDDFDLASRVFDEFVAAFEVRARELEHERELACCSTCTCRCEAMSRPIDCS
ncbi:hypothetical protein [Nannocystis sp. SCPEA4]|uniref:hypothetical protein n=1 Tax=Nannocystis sp. SCPEA4 TaxID=2996787 RepID=UPI00226F561B|nr:hypothetical protein [Nannocystis sp. SCPEA4]MCY1062133.1 hypothetical protein [Nannocystis sp. SCPEA4]